MTQKAGSAKKAEPVAKMYAKALFELAREKNELDPVQQDFAALVEVLTELPQLREALSAFMFPIEDRMRLLKELAEKTQLHPLMARFLDLLTAKSRLVMLDSIYEAFRSLVDESRNMVRGTVTTVEPLTESENSDLSKAFARKLNKQVVLEPIIDKDILGGLIVKIQGLTFDGSLKTTIRRLRDNLERQST